jgi:hypothetical protein
MCISLVHWVEITVATFNCVFISHHTFFCFFFQPSNVFLPKGGAPLIQQNIMHNTKNWYQNYRVPRAKNYNRRMQARAHYPCCIQYGLLLLPCLCFFEVSVMCVCPLLLNINNIPLWTSNISMVLELEKLHHICVPSLVLIVGIVWYQQTMQVLCPMDSWCATKSIYSRIL